jgi:hypothetical protein
MSSGMPLEMGFNIFLLLLLLLYFLLFIVQNIVYIVPFLHFFSLDSFIASTVYYLQYFSHVDKQ